MSPLLAEFVRTFTPPETPIGGWGVTPRAFLETSCAFLPLSDAPETELGQAVLECAVALSRIPQIRHRERPQETRDLDTKLDYFDRFCVVSDRPKFTSADLTHLFSRYPLSARCFNLYHLRRILSQGFTSGIPSDVEAAICSVLDDSRHWTVPIGAPLRNRQLVDLSRVLARSVGRSKDECYLGRLRKQHIEEMEERGQEILSNSSADYQRIYAETNDPTAPFTASRSEDAAPEFRARIYLDGLRLGGARVEPIWRGPVPSSFVTGFTPDFVPYPAGSSSRKHRGKETSAHLPLEFTSPMAVEALEILIKRDTSSISGNSPALLGVARALPAWRTDLAEKINSSSFSDPAKRVLLAPFGKLPKGPPKKPKRECAREETVRKAELAFSALSKVVAACPGWGFPPDAMPGPGADLLDHHHMHSLGEAHHSILSHLSDIGAGVVAGFEMTLALQSLQRLRHRMAVNLERMESGDGVLGSTMDRLKNFGSSEMANARLKGFLTAFPEIRKVPAPSLRDRDQALAAERNLVRQFNLTLDRILAMEPYAKLAIDAQPGSGASKPTKAWLSAAQSHLTPDRVGDLKCQMAHCEIPLTADGIVDCFNIHFYNKKKLNARYSETGFGPCLR